MATHAAEPEAATAAAQQPTSEGQAESPATHQPAAGPQPAANHQPPASPEATGNPPLTLETLIEADNDVDSAQGDDSESFTTSLKSGVTNYQYENGRRYHAFKEGSYYMPNDEVENDRLDLLHHILNLACSGELHYAPLKSPQKILDLGTGTGLWAIDMADTFTSAEVIGNDLSPIQPAMVPPNCKFEIDDMENEWIFDSKFDYIHARYLAGAVGDWPRLMRQAFQFTKPGGWVEFQDFTMQFYTHGGEYTLQSAIGRCSMTLIEAIEAFGKVAEPGPKLEGWTKDAGFVNVQHKVLPIPLGMWPKQRKLKEIGAINMVHFVQGIESMTLRALTAIKGWSHEEVQLFLADVRKDLKNPRMQMQHDFHIVWAQKPLDAE